MAKSTPLGVQNALTGKIKGFHDRASAIKNEFYDKRKAVLDDPRLSEQARGEDVQKLLDQTNTTLKSLRGEQEAYVSGLKDSLEKELRGNQPSDANSILLRRDASARARKIGDEKEALAALRDAVHDGDETMAHAIGYIARQSGWVDAAEAWQSAFPSTAGVAEALSYVESYTTSAAYNLANSMTYASPSA